MAREELTTRLMGLWNFDQQDLDANRSGRLSERQLARIAQNKQRLKGYSSFNATFMVMVVFVVLLVGGGLIVLMMSRATGGVSNQMPVLLAVIAVGVVLVLGLIIFSSRRTSRNIESAKDNPIDLLTVTGPVKYYSSGNPRWGYAYGVEVQGVRFTLSNTDGQQAFVEGETYRIHYVAIEYAKGIPAYPEFMSAEAT